MHYEVEVNVGRRGRPPVYRRIEDADGKPAKWSDKTEAAYEMMAEGRTDFRVIHVPDAVPAETSA